MERCKKQFETLGNGLLVRAPGKINLSLLIAGKRPDGFHEIETIMAKINWYDELLIEPNEKAGIELICQGPEWAPQSKDNLVYQACKLLMDTCHIKADIRLTLTKNIPAGTGLGSASSDAAATLMGLDRFFKLGLSEPELTEMAAKLGSDVAFFLGGPLAFCCGKGEKVKKIEKKFDFVTILLIPNVNSSTAKVYDNYTHDKTAYTTLKTVIVETTEKNDIDLTPQICANMLTKSCFQLYGELADLKAEVESLGFGPWCLSGSGSVMFCVVGGGDGEKADEYQRELEEKVDCKSRIVSNNCW